MIIKRKYATYGQLNNDSISREAIVGILKKYGTSSDTINYIVDSYNPIIVCNTEMSSGIPAKAFEEIVKKLEELDDTHPFDNGMTYRDVSDVRTYPSRKGAAAVQVMYSRKADMPTRVVQVLAFEYRNGVTTVIEPWDIGGIEIV